MDAQELAQVERAMEEEHRRDREALERLKRFLHPGKNGNSVHAATAAKSASGKDDAETAAVYTIISRVAEIMTANPSRKWSGPQMLDEVRSAGSPVSAQRPLSTINRVFRKLVKRRVIRRVRTGKGTTPHLYRAIRPTQSQGGSPIE